METKMSNNIVVLVPGYTATQLERVNDDKPNVKAWPLNRQEINKYLKILRKNGRKEALRYLTKLLGDPELKATKIPQFTKLLCKKKSIYAKMASHFCSLAGYKNILYQNTESLPKNENLFIQMPYDWRRTNAYVTDDGNQGHGSSVTLNNTLTDIYKQLGDDINIYLVAHSMGGLVSRALLETDKDEKGQPIAKPWKHRLMGLFTLGTPHLGSPTTLKAICGQLGHMKIISETFQSLIDISGYSGGYELLPYFKGEEGWNFINDEKKWIGLYSQLVKDEIEHKGYNKKNWEKAIKLFSNLNYQGSTPGSYGIDPLPYHCLYSYSFAKNNLCPGKTCHQFSFKESVLKAIDQKKSGDGLVTPYSGSFGQDTQYDCQGSTPISITGVYPKEYSGIQHMKLPTRKKISQFIIDTINDSCE